MTTTTEAQRITGIDRGKHVTFPGAVNRILTGTLVQVKHLGDGNTTLVIQTEDGRLEWDHVPPATHVTITGRPPCVNPSTD